MHNCVRYKLPGSLLCKTHNMYMRDHNMRFGLLCNPISSYFLTQRASSMVSSSEWRCPVSRNFLFRAMSNHDDLQNRLNKLVAEKDALELELIALSSDSPVTRTFLATIDLQLQRLQAPIVRLPRAPPPNPTPDPPPNSTPTPNPNPQPQPSPAKPKQTKRKDVDLVQKHLTSIQQAIQQPPITLYQGYEKAAESLRESCQTA
ncbi:hypothetical protein K438DRAFT_2054333 [Mycena galopus ATCC 62051]|nr:hypothetical protein K438DRAFT_2054333 [Mycena galopus ATCC 62051]